MASEMFNVENLKLNLAHIRHENALLKTELLHAHQRNERDVTDLQHIHNSKMAELEQFIKKLEEKGSSNQDQFKQEQKHLQQLNLQHSQKLKLYEDELAAASKDHEKICNQNKTRYSQLQSLLKQSEGELQTCKESNLRLTEKICSLEMEVDKERTLNHELEITLSSERHQLKIITSRVEEIEQQCQVQLTAAKAEIEKYKMQIRSLDEKFQRHLEEMRESVEKEKNLHQETSEKAANAEREAKRKCAELREGHLAESQELIHENTQLLKKIKTMQQSLGRHDTAGIKRNEMQEMAEEMQSKIQELCSLKKEKLRLQAKAEECDELKEELAKDKLNTRNLHQEVQAIVTQAKTYKKENSDLQTLNNCLSESLAEKEKTLRTLTQDVQKERSLHHQMLTDDKLRGEEHLAETQARISCLENQLVKKSQDYLKESTALREKVKQYGNLIKKLRSRLETAVIKEEQLEARNEVLKQDFVPSYRYRELQHKLQHMISKHAQFKAFIQGFSKTQESATQALDKRIKAGGFDRHLAQVQLLSGGSGRCTAKLEIAKEHHNVGGTMHGGLTATLVDMISTLALMTSEKGVPGSSVDLKVSYLRPVKANDTIVIEADVLKVGKSLAYLAVQIRNENSGKIVATGEHIKFVGGS